MQTETTGINWNTGTKQIARDNHENRLQLNGREIDTTKYLRKEDFLSTHTKLTIYLEDGLLQVLKEMKRRRHINSISSLVSNALTQYLTGQR